MTMRSLLAVLFLLLLSQRAAPAGDPERGKILWLETEHVECRRGAPRGLAVATTSGCVQCHHPQFNTGRGVMGAIDANYVWFKGMVYAHSAVYPVTRAQLGEPPFERLGMGNFSPSRLPESMLQDMWMYIVGLGFRARMHGELSAGVPSTDGVVYTLDVKNTGVEDIGLTAEDVTVTLVVPAGATVA